MREIDIRQTDIRCCDELQVHEDYISVPWESTLIIDQYFGIFLKPSEYLEFETKYYKDGHISATYYLMAETPDDPEVVLDIKEWKLLPQEEEFFRTKMEEYCQEEYSCNIYELQNKKTMCL